MVMKADYKQTELGMIPIDWEVSNLEKYTDKIGSGITPTGGSSIYKLIGHPFIRSQNVGWGHLLLDDVVYIDDFTHSIFLNTEIQEGDIFLNITGASIGRSAEANAMVVGGNVNQHVCIVRTKKSKLFPKFLCYCLLSPIVQKQINDYQAGGNRQGLNFKQVGALKVLFPPIPEQQAIVAVLFDIDGYIAAIEKLIAKKKAVKQGAMQELLTGKRRLPGFKGEWESVRLGEILLSAKSGGTPLTSVNSYYNGDISFLSINDITVQGKYLYYTSNRISKDGLNNSASWVVPVDSIIYSMYASVGFVSIAKVPMAISQAVLCLELKSGYHTEFLYYLLIYIQPNIFKFVGEGTQKNLNAKTVKNFELKIPSPAEQTAIAEILSDIDAEIDALTAKLKKARLIKQGMMRELLTGRIRLVDEETVAEIADTPKVVELLKPKAKRPSAKGHNKAIADAVILAVVADLYATNQFPLTPFYSQKFPYLLHRHMEGVAQGYNKLAAGPYNAELKYKTALPIAKKNRYIRTIKISYKGKTYQAVLVGDNIEQAKSYFVQWHGDEPLKWLEQFRYIKNRRDELELLTTVDMAMVELRKAGNPTTVQTVKAIIQANEEWKAKLKRKIFSDANIDRAINWSNELFKTEIQSK